LDVRWTQGGNTWSVLGGPIGAFLSPLIPARVASLKCSTVASRDAALDKAIFNTAGAVGEAGFYPMFEYVALFRGIATDKPAVRARDLSRSCFPRIARRRGEDQYAAMKAEDRGYFLLRAKQERAAASHTRGPVRGRHEELASLYEMRIMYIDRGVFGDDFDEVQEPPVVPHIIVPA
jgi:hypothetical protein